MADKLNWKALAIAFGIFNGVYLALSALYVMYDVSFLWFSIKSFGMLKVWYPFLEPTWLGVLYGLIGGALCGAFCGGVLAGLYNWAGKKWK